MTSPDGGAEPRTVAGWKAALVVILAVAGVFLALNLRAERDIDKLRTPSPSPSSTAR